MCACACACACACVSLRECVPGKEKIRMQHVDDVQGTRASVCVCLCTYPNRDTLLLELLSKRPEQWKKEKVCAGCRSNKAGSATGSRLVSATWGQGQLFPKGIEFEGSVDQHRGDLPEPKNLSFNLFRGCFFLVVATSAPACTLTSLSTCEERLLKSAQVSRASRPGKRSIYLLLPASQARGVLGIAWQSALLSGFAIVHTDFGRQRRCDGMVTAACAHLFFPPPR
ncbi:hypothetical protein B0T26DRAFT_285604 [Lasiosphaeria miniovina]|uniref:Uncharacterized protein n=1 Tax=Lasiosphaeria miniovina TaxID=1954250 RepID=A0AA40DUS6_9PEZI|nr:uncharacterized protein B0T26DRAFT_285604 [Lasiosphaeria miniovina]KAK0717169.1 hypothetical protein B0T26DRAFT_285604 [Lasiosphaeria miniovina]